MRVEREKKKEEGWGRDRFNYKSWINTKNCRIKGKIDETTNTAMYNVFLVFRISSFCRLWEHVWWVSLVSTYRKKIVTYAYLYVTVRE